MSFRSALLCLFRRKNLDADMAEEMRLHLERRTQANLAAGLLPDEARYAAMRQFGGVEQLKEVAREQRGLRWVEEIARAVRHSVRSMHKRPGFTATALAILGLCLGANLTIFAVIDSLLLRPLPFPGANRLVTLFNTYPKAGVERDGASLTNYYERRGQIAAFSDLAIVRFDSSVVGEPGSTEQVDTARVSPEFFQTLGVGPALGRAFDESETSRQTDAVAILTDAYWRQYFNADVNVLGREIRVDGIPKKIVGVLSPAFRFLSSTARIYLPYSSDPRDREPLQRHSGNSIAMVARLRPGISLAAAEAEVAAQDAALADSYPQARQIADAGFRSVVVPLQADHVKGVRPTLWLLQAGALLLLLIGSLNLVNLLLIRASGRAKEFAVRQIMGATGRHVVTEVMAETVLLALCGGAAGLALAWFGIELVTTLGANRLPLGAQVAFDLPFALVALLGTAALGVVIAFPLAWFNLRPHLARSLQESSRGSTASRAAQTLRHGFIVTQIALAFLLLSGAGLLGLSLQRAMAVSPGFKSDHVLTGQLTLPWKNYQGAAYLPFAGKLTAEIARQPGVTAAGLATKLPLSGSGRPSSKLAITVKGHVAQPGETIRAHYGYGVIGDYFSALRIPLRQGRFVDTEDSYREARVCAVDEDFARRYWPKGDALGQQLFIGSREGPAAEAFTVVGVVGAVKQTELTDNEALGTAYVPLAYRPQLSLFVVARADVPPETLGSTLRALVRRIDPDLPLNELRPMEARVADTLAARRAPALLAGIFAGVALLLSAVGTYGVLAYAVSQRQREIGVRMALGALPRQVLTQFLSLGAKLLLAGLLIGAFAAWSVSHAMQGLLFSVGALEPGVLAAAATTLAVIVLVAVWKPSRRAAKISPVEALRSE